MKLRNSDSKSVESNYTYNFISTKIPQAYVKWVITTTWKFITKIKSINLYFRKLSLKKKYQKHLQGKTLEIKIVHSNLPSRSG